MNVVSYCLYGAPTDPREQCDQTKTCDLYWKYAPLNIAIANRLYPGWEVRLHVDAQFSSHPEHQPIATMARSGLVTIVPVVTLSGHARMLWRLAPLFDIRVEHAVLRDLDSIISPTESRLVRLWLSGGQRIHCIRSHPFHSAPIMGGLSGFHSQTFRQQTGMSSLTEVERCLPGDRRQTDQQFLANHVLPRYGKGAVCDHRIRGCRRPNNPTLPTPTEWEARLSILDEWFPVPGDYHVVTGLQAETIMGIA